MYIDVKFPNLEFVVRIGLDGVTSRWKQVQAWRVDLNPWLQRMLEEGEYVVWPHGGKRGDPVTGVGARKVVGTYEIRFKDARIQISEEDVLRIATGGDIRC